MPRIVVGQLHGALRSPRVYTVAESREIGPQLRDVGAESLHGEQQFRAEGITLRRSASDRSHHQCACQPSE